MRTGNHLVRAGVEMRARVCVCVEGEAAKTIQERERERRPETHTHTRRALLARGYGGDIQRVEKAEEEYIQREQRRKLT